MVFFGRIFAVVLFSLTAVSASASQPLINVMQGCQAALEFVVNKVDAKPPPPNAAASELTDIRGALVAYNNAIQEQLITPGLSTFSNGDTAKAESLQAQVDQYKASIVKAYEKRYPQLRLFTDYAVAINNCTEQWMPKAFDSESLKSALLSLVTIAGRTE